MNLGRSGIAAMILVLATAAHAVEGFEPELRNAEGVSAATRQHDRPILLFFTAPWCTACEGVKRKILSSEAAADLLSHYALVEIDIEHGPREAELAEQWEVSALPTLILLAADGSSRRYSGRLERKPLLRWLEQNLNAAR